MKKSFRASFKSKHIFFLGLLIILFWSLPLWMTPHKIGGYDWGFYMCRFEALRRTVVDYGQWPGNNPWSMGGQPLLGHTGVSILSIKAGLVLLFGTIWGLKLSIPVYLLIGFWGCWKLSGLWWHNRFIRLIFCLYVIANPALIYHISVGHINFQTFYFFPLLFYYLLTFKKDNWSGLKAAICAGLAINDSPAYMSQYALLFIGCSFIYLYIKNRKQYGHKLFNWLLLFISISTAITFYRIITIMEISSDFPRILNYKIHYGITTLLKAYLVPYVDMPKLCACKYCANSWEICCYIGITSLVLIITGLRLGYKWYHTVILLLIWAWIGNDSYFYIMYWLQKIPTFSSHLCFSRIRVFLPLFFGIAATEMLNFLWGKCSQRSNICKRRIISIGILMAAEVLIVSNLIMQKSNFPMPQKITMHYNKEFKNAKYLPETKRYPDIYPAYIAMQMNFGWVDGYGDSYLPSETMRLGIGDPNYVAEYIQDNNKICPAYWSPNKIIFRNLNPNKPLLLNINPGNPWYANGSQLFPDYRIVEQEKPFKVMPDKNGSLELVYKYPGQKIGLLGTLLWAIISFLIIGYSVKNNN